MNEFPDLRCLDGIGVGIKLIRVLRHPLDNIATLAMHFSVARRTGPSATPPRLGDPREPTFRTADRYHLLRAKAIEPLDLGNALRNATSFYERLLHANERVESRLSGPVYTIYSEQFRSVPCDQLALPAP
jgi:hypothetical protein